MKKENKPLAAALAVAVMGAALSLPCLCGKAQRKKREEEEQEKQRKEEEAGEKDTEEKNTGEQRDMAGGR